MVGQTHADGCYLPKNKTVFTIQSNFRMELMGSNIQRSNISAAAAAAESYSPFAQKGVAPLSSFGRCSRG